MALRGANRDNVAAWRLPSLNERSLQFGSSAVRNDADDADDAGQHFLRACFRGGTAVISVFC